MGLNRVLLLGLVVVLATVALAAGACGGTVALDLESKAVLAAALTEFESSAGAITAALAAGSESTAVAEIKAAKQGVAVKWRAVISAAKSVEGADVDGAEQAWASAAQAIDALPASATVAEAGAALSSPMEGLMQAAADLWTLVGSSD